MQSTQKLINESAATFEKSVVKSDFEIGNSRYGIGIIMLTASFLGIWGIICLINGLTQYQDLNELSRGIITALTGI